MGLSLVQAGWISSTLTTLAVFGALGIGLLAARLGALRSVLTGLVLCLLAGAAGIASQGFAGLVLSRIAEGAGFMLVVVAAPALITASTGLAQRRFALGLWGAYMPTGASLALALSPWVLPAAGWRGMWLAGMAALLLAGALVWQQRGAYRAAPADQRLSHAATMPRALTVLRQPMPWLLALAFGVWALQHFALIVWLPTFLGEQRGLGPAPVALLTGAMLIANVPGTLIGGVLLQRGWPRGALIAAAHLATGALAWGIFQEAWPDALRYGLCIALSCIGGLIPSSVLSSSAALARSPQQIGVLQSLLMQGSQAGQFIGTPLIAAVVAASGDWASARWVMVVAAALGLALGLGVWRAERALGDQLGD
jgi:predicted MFS family arabinose efflux permease